MVARLLHDCGLYLGEEADLAPAKPDNPDGFWENLALVDLNEEIFAHLGGGWDLPPAFPSDWRMDDEFQKLRVKAELLVGRFRGREPWGWKDPRNSITIPFWKSVLPNLKVIICVRHPLEVALSLRNRNFLSYELALTLWAIYNRRVLEDASPQQRLVVHYDAFFRRPETEVRRIVQFSGLAADHDRVLSTLDRIRPDLRHATFETRHLIDAGLSPETIRIYLALTAEAGWLDGSRDLPAPSRPEPRMLGSGNGGGADVAQRELFVDSGAGKLNRGALELELVRRQVAASLTELDRRGVRIAELEQQITAIETEVSAADAKTGELQAELAARQAELSRSKRSTDANNLQMRRLKNVLGEIEKTLTSAEMFVERYANAFTNLEGLLPEEEGETPGDDLSSREAALHYRIAKILRVLASSKNDAAEMRMAFDHMAERAAEAERERNASIAASEEMRESLDEFAERVAEAEHERDTNREAAAQLTEALDLMTKRAADAEQERDASRESAESIRRWTASLNDELESIHRSRLWTVGSAYWRLLRWLGRLPGPGIPRAAEPPPFDPIAATPPAEASRAHIAANAAREKLRQVFDPRRATSFVRQKLARKPDAGLQENLEHFAAEHERRFSSRPTILDWTDANATAAMPHDAVFTPTLEGPILPYLDKTFDTVIITVARFDDMVEARRVARHAVVQISRLDPSRLHIEWLESAERAPLCGSIIIPVFNHIGQTGACLDALEQTLPDDFCGEIIVVDDASTDQTASRLAARATTNRGLRVITNAHNQGFIDSCNRGAREAKYEYLIFLNNDTVPQPRWLSSLLQTFTRYPQAGAVGGKLLYPDGRLQEAGARIFADASGLNFGKFDGDPAAPLYNFIREVDYCSGALLATPKKLFEEIGGFDERYRPAYYEDADYCFEVRKRGLKVLYQPESTVIHIEGATSGTDVRSGEKRHQVVNRDKFRDKWQNELTGHPVAPATINREVLHRLATIENRKRVLFINHTVPEYDREGGSRRLFHLIEFMREAEWSVSFMAPWVPWGERYERELQQMGVETYRKGSAKLESGERHETEADRLIATGDFDAAVISFWHIAETWAPRVRALSPRTKVLIDSIDLHFLRQARAALRQPDGGGCLTDAYADEMRREINVYAASDAVLTVSEKEAAIINDFASNPRLAVAVPETEPPFSGALPFDQRSGILFIGSFRHPPNIEAVAFLAQNVLPLVDGGLLDEHPVYIVGYGLDARVQEVCANVRNVRLVGWVPSLDDYLRRARISVLPLLNGAGTKTKLIQALNAGTPSVSTRIGAEGLPIRDGEHVLIADDPAEFAASIERLLTDRSLWERIAAAGQHTIQQTHGRAVGSAKLLGVMREVLSRR